MPSIVETAVAVCSASRDSVSRSEPMILMPTGVLMPVESMLIRFSIGNGQALATPGKVTAGSALGAVVPSGSVQPHFSSSVVIGRSPARECAAAATSPRPASR